jgi:hypothetical protein
MHLQWFTIASALLGLFFAKKVISGCYAVKLYKVDKMSTML